MKILPTYIPHIINKMMEMTTIAELIMRQLFLLDPQAVTLSEKIAMNILAIHGKAIIPSNKVISPGYNPSLSLKIQYNPSSKSLLKPYAKLEINITIRKLQSQYSNTLMKLVLVPSSSFPLAVAYLNELNEDSVLLLKSLRRLFLLDELFRSYNDGSSPS